MEDKIEVKKREKILWREYNIKIIDKEGSLSLRRTKKVQKLDQKNS